MRDFDPRPVLLALSVWSLALPAGAEPPAAEAPPRKAAGDTEAARKPTTVAVIRLTGSVPDGVGQAGLLADVSPHLHRLEINFYHLMKYKPHDFCCSEKNLSD